MGPRVQNCREMQNPENCFLQEPMGPRGAPEDSRGALGIPGHLGPPPENPYALQDPTAPMVPHGPGGRARENRIDLGTVAGIGAGPPGCLATGSRAESQSTGLALMNMAAGKGPGESD